MFFSSTPLLGVFTTDAHWSNYACIEAVFGGGFCRILYSYTSSDLWKLLPDLSTAGSDCCSHATPTFFDSIRAMMFSACMRLYAVRCPCPLPLLLPRYGPASAMDCLRGYSLLAATKPSRCTDAWLLRCCPRRSFAFRHADWEWEKDTYGAKLSLFNSYYLGQVCAFF